jgi:hypothetical protein
MSALTSDQIATYTFLPWLRQGLVSKIKTQDNLGAGAGPGERALVRISLQVNGDPNFVSQNVQLIGPGDVLGISPRAIVRSEPRNWVTDFEPNYLAFIEIYEEDFPWRFTPARAVQRNAAGNPVTYVPANVIDGDVQTAWRAPGDGRGVTLTLIFDHPVDVARIGLIPGYAKTDPLTGANRFLQDRIIDAVAWQVPGLPATTQTFRPLPVPQFVRLSATTSRITVRILDTSPSGGLDYTAISEIYVYGDPR